LTIEKGNPVSFLIQLEKEILGSRTPESGEYQQIVRFDHNRGFHDVSHEGLHMDVFNEDGEKIQQRWDFPDIKLKLYPDYCMFHIERHLEDILRRFHDGN
jgi:hypothetical protein